MVLYFCMVDREIFHLQLSHFQFSSRFTCINRMIILRILHLPPQYLRKSQDLRIFPAIVISTGQGSNHLIPLSSLSTLPSVSNTTQHLLASAQPSHGYNTSLLDFHLTIVSNPFSCASRMSPIVCGSHVEKVSPHRNLPRVNLVLTLN